ncbi:hypothetical protein L917_06580, partial [Phytophthora nicotianae]
AEIYQGKLDSDKKDRNQGPNAVIRNIDLVLDGLPKRRLIITDRFYSSVLRSSILLQRFVPRGVIPYKQAKRPKSMTRGLYRVAVSKVEPMMVAVSWMDNRPVHFIATGCSIKRTTLPRRQGADIVQVPAPQLIKDYQNGMGGADTHDQLRLQRYSIQGAMKMKKYYHTIILGLVDMSLVNAYIIYRHEQSDLSVEALADRPVSSCSVPRYALPAKHTLEQVESRRRYRTKDGKEGTKRRQYACKVCSILRVGASAWETTYYCVECSLAKEETSKAREEDGKDGSSDESEGGTRGKIYLCQKVRQHDPDGPKNSATFSQIWHDLWRAGANIPPGAKSIRLRAPPGTQSVARSVTEGSTNGDNTVVTSSSCVV